MYLDSVVPVHALPLLLHHYLTIYLPTTTVYKNLRTHHIYIYCIYVLAFTLMWRLNQVCVRVDLYTRHLDTTWFYWDVLKMPFSPWTLAVHRSRSLGEEAPLPRAKEPEQPPPDIKKTML